MELKKWREKNRERINLKKREWAKRNPEKVKEMNLNWKKRNPESYKATTRKYYLTAKPKMKERHLIRSCAQKTIKKQLLEKIGCCEKCKSNENLELHHIKYKNTRENVKLLCKNCHLKEHRGVL